MANSYLVEIGINDSLTDVVRKCNSNFKRISIDQSKTATNKVRREKDRSEAALDGAIGEINTAIDNAKKELDNKVAEATKKLNDTLADLEKRVNDLDESVDSINQAIANATQPKLFAPPVGTYIYSTTNPSKSWTGTTWTQVAEGNFLIASGSTYKSGSSYGSNKVTLTIDQIPSHVHDLPDHLISNDVERGAHGTDYFLGGGQNLTMAGILRETSSAGGGQAHNNIPQSIAVPLWKRTA